MFEVKLKREDGETDKRQTEDAVSDADRLTDSARQCLEEALSDAGLDAPGRLSATLETRFQRATLASREGSERLTCDTAVRLSRSRTANCSIAGG